MTDNPLYLNRLWRGEASRIPQQFPSIRSEAAPFYATDLPVSSPFDPLGAGVTCPSGWQSESRVLLGKKVGSRCRVRVFRVEFRPWTASRSSSHNRKARRLSSSRTSPRPRGVLRTLVAFANTAGGTLVIGVEDKTRHVVGVSDPLTLEERLTNGIADQVAPLLVPDIEILPWRRTHVLVVRVHPSPTRPHYLKRLGPERGVFVRVGSTNRLADATLIEELRRYSRNETFDEQPMTELDSEAIDFRAASESFADQRALRRRDLETLRLVVRYQGRLVPTVGGILLFGRDRDRHFPDAWIQVGRFAGADRTRILDSQEIRTSLPQAVEQAVAFIRRHTAREVIVEAVRHTERWTYPLAAVREALINAVVHADYAQRGAPIRVSLFADRLEIENPGLLPFGLTVEDIQRGISKLRNRVIGRVFHALGLIEQWGSGIQRMLQACEQAGLDPPRLEEIGTHFRVTIAAARRSAPAMDELDRTILDALAQSTGSSTAEIARRIGRSARATRSRLASLVERGLVAELGSGLHDPRRKYVVVHHPIGEGEEP